MTKMMIVVRKEIISRDSFPMLGKWMVVGEKQCTVGKVEQGRQPLSDISPRYKKPMGGYHP